MTSYLSLHDRHWKRSQSLSTHIFYCCSLLEKYLAKKNVVDYITLYATMAITSIVLLQEIYFVVIEHWIN